VLDKQEAEAKVRKIKPVSLAMHLSNQSQTSQIVWQKLIDPQI